MAFSQLLRRGRFNVLVKMDKKTVDRLSTTCFRGKALNRSGNFSEWCSIEEVLADVEFRNELLFEFREMAHEEEFGTISVEIDCRRPIGWASTAKVAEFRSEDLEEFRLNKRSHAMRLKLDRQEIRAPKTSIVTVIVEYKDYGRGPFAIIHSMYPGPDIGQLDGHMTNEQGVVFFDFSHPGE